MHLTIICIQCASSVRALHDNYNNINTSCSVHLQCMQPASAVGFYLDPSEWLIYESSEQNFSSVQFYTSIRPSLGVIDGPAEIHHLCHCFWHDQNLGPRRCFSTSSNSHLFFVPVTLPFFPAIHLFPLSLSCPYPIGCKAARWLSFLDNNNLNVQKWYAALMGLANVKTAGGQTSNPKCVQHLAHASRLKKHFHDQQRGIL